MSITVSWLFSFQTKSIIITHTEKESRFFIIRTKGCFVEGTPFKSVVSGLMNKYDKSVERLRNTNRVHLADMFYAKTLFCPISFVWKMFRKIAASQTQKKFIIADWPSVKWKCFFPLLLRWRLYDCPLLWEFGKEMQNHIFRTCETKKKQT